MVLNFLKRLDRRFKVLLASIGILSWSSGLSSQYNQLYAIFLGADPINLGSLEGLGGAASAFFSVPAGWFVDRFGAKKMLIFGLALITVTAVIYGCALNWLMLIPAIVLARMGMWLIMPLADIIIVGVTDYGRRSFAISISRVIWTISSLFSPLIAAIMISYFGGMSAEGIRPLYFVQIPASLLAILLVLAKLEHLPTQKSPSQQPQKFDLIQSYRELVKSEKLLKHWIVAVAAMNLWAISLPYIPLWMVKVKGADQNILGLIGTLSILSSLLMMMPIGKLSDAIGRKKVFLLFRPLVYAGTLLLAWAPNHIVLIIAGILGLTALMGAPGMGGIGGASSIPLITMFFESFSPEKRGRAQGLVGLLNLISSMAALLGGLLWNMGYMEVVLLLPLLTDILILIPTIIHMPENPSNGQKSQH